MPITKINNQAVELYTPSETVFNDKVSSCEWHLDYHPRVTCDDVTEIVVDSSVSDPDIGEDSGFDVNVTGNTTSTVANELNDTGATFITDGVVVGMVARRPNTSEPTGIVTIVHSETRLTLDTDVFQSDPLAYAIAYWDISGLMDISAGTLVQSHGVGGSCTQTGQLTSGNLYKLSIDVNSFSSTVEGAQINLVIGGVTILTLDETDVPTGTYTAYGYANPSLTDFSVSAEAGIAAAFDNFAVSLVTNLVYLVIDCCDDTLAYTSVAADVLNSTLSNQIKISMDWSNLLDGYTCEGCYYLAIIEDVTIPADLELDRINDGDFLGAGWNLGAGWSHSGTDARLNTASGAGDLTQTSLAVDFSKSISYDVVFDVTGYVDGSFDVKLYNGAVEVADLGNFSADGTHTVSTGVLTDTCTVIKFEPGSGSQHFNIDNVSALMDIADTSFDFRTDCFQLASEHACTVKLSGTNLDNAFGIDFLGLNYTPVIRVQGELETPIYDGDKENEEDSSGVSKTLYFKSEKKRQLFLYQQPVHIHDFIRLLLGYDDLTVDDVSYVSENASYAPEAERVLGKLPDLSNVSTEVRLKTDLNENKFC